MKTFVCIVALVVIIASCSKSSGGGGTVVVPTPVLSTLTGKQWYFDTVYSNYNSPGTGQLIYARGSSTNIQDFDTTHFIFNTDLTEDIYNLNTPGSHVQVPWAFPSTDSTLLFFPINSYNTTPQYQRILKLDSAHLTLYDSTQATLNITSVNH